MQCIDRLIMIPNERHKSALQILFAWPMRPYNLYYVLPKRIHQVMPRLISNTNYILCVYSEHLILYF